jgi:hypothetical protein
MDFPLFNSFTAAGREALVIESDRLVTVSSLCVMGIMAHRIRRFRNSSRPEGSLVNMKFCESLLKKPVRPAGTFDVGASLNR